MADRGARGALAGAAVLAAAGLAFAFGTGGGGGLAGRPAPVPSDAAPSSPGPDRLAVSEPAPPVEVGGLSAAISAEPDGLQVEASSPVRTSSGWTHELVLTNVSSEVLHLSDFGAPVTLGRPPVLIAGAQSCGFGATFGDGALTSGCEATYRATTLAPGQTAARTITVSANQPGLVEPTMGVSVVWPVRIGVRRDRPWTAADPVRMTPTRVRYTVDPS